MGCTQTSKSQVTVLNAMPLHLGVQPGAAVNFEVSPKAPDAPENPFRQFLGMGIAGLSTEEILRETRGEYCFE